MKRPKTLSLSKVNASLQREIARRIKRGLPITGLLAATLFCGCGEQQSGGLSGAIAPASSVKGENANPPDNRPNERFKVIKLMGIPLPPPKKADSPDNSGNENKRPMVDGLMPKKKAEKEMPERRLKSARPMLPRLPSSLMLEITSRCNYKCPFCYCVWHEFPELARPALSTAAWKGIIEECAAQGVKSLLFTGGEALLRPDATELIDYARRLLPEGDLALFTNGSRMTEDLLRWLKRRKIRISTSLQGLRTYGELTGTHRSYRRLLSLVARAAELDWRIAVSITVNRVNLHEVADLFAAAALARPETIQVGAVMAEGRARSRLELMLTRAEWEGVKENIRHLPDCGVPYSFCDEFYCHCRDFPAEWSERFGEDAKPCPAGRDFGVIGPNGKFRKCLHTVEAFEWRKEGKGTK